MDKNSSIGLVLISAILLVYFVFFAPSPTPPQEETKSAIESAEKKDSTTVKQAVAVDSVKAGFLIGNASTEKTFVLENKDLKVEISSFGGVVKKAVLKNHTDHNDKTLVLIDENSFEQRILIPLQNGSLSVSELNFEGNQQGNELALNAENAEGQKVSMKYKLAESGFLLNFDIAVANLPLDAENNVKITLFDRVIQTEKNINNNKIATSVTYYKTDNKYSSLSETSTDAQKEEVGDAYWIGFKRKFFLFGFIAENKNLKNTLVSSSPVSENEAFIKNLKASFELKTEDLRSGKASFKYYLGTNDYHTVKKIADGFGENVYLGWPVVNIFNKYIIIPIFNFLEGITSNYGLIIFLLVVIVKLVLFPLSYKAYLSMAKIKVLKPEMDEIKARVGDDMAAMQQEQMKLYQSVGVNPLAGCIPVLLQMPILLAMFNFFPNAFELRHKSFLWADDLSTYDSILNLPFSIPFGYGDHVSLFTILMTASTLLYTWYNMQMQTTTMQGPMVYVQYFMPLIFMFVLNSMSSGLTYYYFVSNLITISQQFLIKQFVNEEEVRAKLDSYKSTASTRKKSRFQTRMEEAIKAQEEAKKKRPTPKKK